MSVSLIGYGLAVIGAGIGVGLSAFGGATGTARQPEMQPKIFQTFILGAAFSEALALIGFVLVLIGY
ncbi:MAG: ATPase [Coriobacteriales bacterium]|jgi:F-type H+-transporting ATPase subunit c|nr:ATPase [Coriobacteriales bacterium]